MRSTWTDERLDDLKDEVVRTRDEVARQGARIDKVGERMDALGERMDALGERMDTLNHTVLVLSSRLFAGFIAVTVAIVGLIATQL